MTIADIFADLPVIETERLLLRRMTLDDAAGLYAYAVDPEVSHYTTWSPPQSIDDSRAYLSGMIARYDRGEVAEWGIVHKSDRKFIGTCGFIEWNTRHNRAEIGYALSRVYWKHGYMTEAIGAVITFGFLQMELNRIEAKCIPENIGSATVMEKNGMKKEGTLRDYMYAKESYHDLDLYAILRSDWGA
jgi:ribosomal-protein-alanine N-acetyltransferase